MKKVLALILFLAVTVSISPAAEAAPKNPKEVTAELIIEPDY